MMILITHDDGLVVALRFFILSLTPLLKGPEGSTPELTLQLVFFDGEVIINNRINHDTPTHR